MANHRRSVEHAILNGQAQAKPHKYVNRPKAAKLGPPPNNLSPEERTAWNQYVAEIPWLMESDRFLMIAISVLRAEFEETRREFPVKKLTVLRQFTQMLGGSPADRTRVASPDQSEDKTDPEDQYFN